MGIEPFACLRKKESSHKVSWRVYASPLLVVTFEMIPLKLQHQELFRDHPDPQKTRLEKVKSLVVKRLLCRQDVDGLTSELAVLKFELL